MVVGFLYLLAFAVIGLFVLVVTRGRLGLVRYVGRRADATREDSSAVPCLTAGWCRQPSTMRTGNAARRARLGMDVGTDVIKAANGVVAFLLEIAVLDALAGWGFTVGSHLVTRLVPGLGAPAVLIALWAGWLAPASEQRLAMPGC